MKNKLYAKIRSYIYTIGILTDKTSNENNLCAEIHSYILYLFFKPLATVLLALP